MTAPVARPRRERRRKHRRPLRRGVPAPPGAAGAGLATPDRRPHEGRAPLGAPRAERRVRRLPQLRRRRRPAAARLERLRPPGTPLHQAVRRGGGPHGPRPGRRQPLDGLRRAEQAALRAARGRRAGLPGAGPPGSRERRVPGRRPMPRSAAARCAARRACSRCSASCPEPRPERHDRPGGRGPRVRRATARARSADPDQRPA